MTPLALPIVADPTLPEQMFRCERMSCVLKASACVLRQEMKRGNGPRFPQCTPACPQGAKIREAVGTAFVPNDVIDDSGRNHLSPEAREQLSRERQVAALARIKPTSASPAEKKQIEEAIPMQAKETTDQAERHCSKCQKKLRSSSVGDTCFGCRKAEGVKRCSVCGIGVRRDTEYMTCPKHRDPRSVRAEDKRAAKPAASTPRRAEHGGAPALETLLSLSHEVTRARAVEVGNDLLLLGLLSRLGSLAKAHLQPDGPDAVRDEAMAIAALAVRIHEEALP